MPRAAALLLLLAASALAAAADPAPGDRPRAGASGQDDFFVARKSAHHPEGDCCPGADAGTRRGCRFARPLATVAHAPAARPARFGGPCLAHERVYDDRHPEYSVLVNVFNAQARARLVATQLLKLTHGPWELVALFDACTDGSYAEFKGAVDRSEAWPACPYGERDVDPAAVWQTGVNLTTHQGDIGHECRYADGGGMARPGSGALTRVALVNVTGAELLETAANNVLMLAARAPFLILVQGDMLMTQPGWNVALTVPLRQWDDVFSVSARCAAGFDYSQQPGLLTGAKCSDTLTTQPTDADHRCIFHVRDSGVRGPLAVRAAYAARVGYLDEVRFCGGGDDDMDMNLRAYARHGWVSGHAPVDYTEERCCRSPAARADGGALDAEYRAWLLQRRQAAKDDVAGGVFGAPRTLYKQDGHDEDRRVESAAFHPACGEGVR